MPNRCESGEIQAGQEEIEMDKKIGSMVVLTSVFIAFGVVSSMVILSRRHPYFVEKKLRLGALLLSLGAFATGCRGGGPFATCYVTIPDDMISIDHPDHLSDTVSVQKSDSMFVAGTIEFRRADEFSYLLEDSIGNVLRTGKILPDDGVYDETIEQFRIELGQFIPVGTYTLKIFTVPPDRHCHTRMAAAGIYAHGCRLNHGCTAQIHCFRGHPAVQPGVQLLLQPVAAHRSLPAGNGVPGCTADAQETSYHRCY